MSALLLLTAACQVANPAYDIGRGDAALPDAARPDEPSVDAGSPTQDTQPMTDNVLTPVPMDAVVDVAKMQDGPTTIIAAQRGCDPDNPDLAFCLRFEDNVNDESNQRLAVSGVGAFINGQDGRALDMVNSQSLVSALSPALVSSRFSVDAWLRVQSAPVVEAALVLEVTEVVTMWLTPTGALVCRLGGEGGAEVTAPSAATSLASMAWKAIACTYNGSELAIYVTGLVVASRNVGTWTPVINSSTVRLVERSGFVRLNGNLDNVRVWRRRLTPPELCAAAPNCAL